MTDRTRRQLRWIPALLFALGGPLLGVVAAKLALSLELERAAALCHEHFTNRAASLKQEVNALTEELQDLRLLFLTTGQLTREQFRTFTSRGPDRDPAIAAFEWIPRVPASRRDGLERRARAEGLRDYRILGLTPRGDAEPAPAKDEYLPVLYVEPQEPNARVIGVDLSSDRTSRIALERAASTGEPSLTDPVDLVQDPDGGKGFLVVLSVFHGRAAGGGIAGSGPDGFVLMAVRGSEMFRRVIGSAEADGSRAMTFELDDAAVGGKPVAIAASGDLRSARHYRDWRFVQRIEIGGRRWQLTGRPTDAFVSKQLTRGPLALGVGVFLFWELIGGFALFVVKHARDSAFQRQSRIIEVSLRNLTEGVVVADASGRFLLFNAEAERLLGMGPRDVELAEWSATYGCFYPDTRTPFPSDQLPLARALEGEDASAELFIRNQSVPGGVWISVRGAPLRDGHGVVEGGVVTVRDVTAARTAEERLHASIKQLEDLQYAVDQSSLVAITNRAGTITYANDKFSEVSGYAREELVGQNHRILNSAYHPKSYFKDLWRTIAGGQVWRGRICNRARDGRHFWVDTTIVPLLTNGKPERYLAIRTDITNQMKQEAELVRLSNAVEQTADAIVITDRAGVIEYVNPAFEASTGYSRAEALGQTPRILKSGKEPPDFYRQLWSTILDGRVFRGRPINRRKNGDLYPAEQTITPIKDSEGRIVHFVSVIKDMTDRARIEQHKIEMRYACDVQQRLYPAEAPRLHGFDIAGATFPALDTSGDYYDYLPLPDGRVDIVIGDVSGHGLGPALIMAETRAYLRSLSVLNVEPEEMLTRMNQALCADLDDNRYVALVLARIDPGAMRLAYANAGHVQAYHLDGAGAVKAVMESCGPPLGILPDAIYPATEPSALVPGDIVVLLTDGITETENAAGEAFGSEAALDVVRAHQHEPAQEIVQRLQQATRDFGNGVPQQDDVTVVICKVGQVA